MALPASFLVKGALLLLFSAEEAIFSTLSLVILFVLLCDKIEAAIIFCLFDAILLLRVLAAMDAALLVVCLAIYTPYKCELLSKYSKKSTTLDLNKDRRYV
jgi:hypothetical protein